MVEQPLYIVFEALCKMLQNVIDNVPLFNILKYKFFVRLHGEYITSWASWKLSLLALM